MRSLTLVLLFLISVQAAFNMGGHTQAQGPANQHAAAERSPRSPGHPKQQDTHYDDEIPTVDPKIFNKRRYRSPRVLFSEVIPPEGETGASRRPRFRRRANEFLHRGEYSVCDSEEHWVGNLTRATDLAGNEVTVLPHVRINNVVKKQLFYETTCRVSKPSGSPKPGQGASGVKAGTSSCRGIDHRHWNSYCTNTHTYVRALTSYKNQIAWRFIRINAACVCVLSRNSWRL
ncbi:neurotrophin-7 [Triplophysa rosa]|uniref:Neurotrophin-7 n=1 Tax=Triplophysa rosa TaxID=992332 RepID=A0A9W7WC78_TRIRA|nr:neurotrophin-7 [Triplophysa rosa]XP_057176010.1 neurotrophin-7 [Triplophysa rosa]XP_057176011.1 neurotrophin-7 [Triplophysa rosa]XP_057176012.1 neurotrophin-7 [Triplophysa rosa]KAI7794701.1 neurotrophin-7 precursor [Triplophysa rosa]